MQLNRKGSSIGIPVWLLALTLVSLMGKVGLQRPWGEGSMNLIAWHHASEVPKLSSQQKLPVLIFFVGPTSLKTSITESSVLRNKLVAKVIVDGYYPVRVQDNGIDSFKVVRGLHRHYYISEVPSMIVTTPGGKEVGALIGCKPASVTYQFLKSLLDSEVFKSAIKKEAEDKLHKKTDKRTNQSGLKGSGSNQSRPNQSGPNQSGSNQANKSHDTNQQGEFERSEPEQSDSVPDHRINLFPTEDK